MDRRELIAELASRIAVIARPHPVRVAIDGVDAAGKTTLADELTPCLEALGRPVIRASIDGFHHPAHIRRRRGALSPEGYFEDSFDHDAVQTWLLRPLGPGGSRLFKRAVFDVRADQPVDAPLESAAPDAVLVVDGVFLQRRELHDGFDYVVFVRAGFDVTLARAERRDVALLGSVAEVRRRYLERYIPGQRLYLARVDPEHRADVVIDNTDPARPEWA